MFSARYVFQFLYRIEMYNADATIFVTLYTHLPFVCLLTNILFKARKKRR